MPHDPEKATAGSAKPGAGEIIFDWPAAFEFADMHLEEGELPDGAVLIIRTHLDGDRTRVITRPSIGTDWVTVRGLIEVARDEQMGRLEADEDDDDEDGPAGYAT